MSRFCAWCPPEFLDPGRRRQRAGDVQVRAANEDVVARQVRGNDAQFLPFFLGEAIDQCAGCEVVIGDRQAQRDRRAERADLSLIAGHHRRLAAHVQRTHQAGAIDHGDIRVVAFVLGALRHIDDGAVAVMSMHRELLAIGWAMMR